MNFFMVLLFSWVIVVICPVEPAGHRVHFGWQELAARWQEPIGRTR
ncbi:hypothetical protein MJO55_06475 [Mycolicibacterium rufum]|uniref:Uncharacterized protein n=1 Tax=Mycolicibacterium rufum TaxID=318424 RepID=A0A9X2YD49_9MYCO|nr:hypothetical protein [Mycolicibacterium rufum]MCV7070506.1 hypothetical protein [Mycolicibacterium rufum]ULP38067.1 hypothetical protein MJO55_06475 [Mycolicibacterium rufum]